MKSSSVPTIIYEIPNQHSKMPIADSDEADLGLDSVFTVRYGPAECFIVPIIYSQEAPRPPSPEATFSTYQGLHKEFRIRLVGSHPLWGHHL